MGAKQRLRSQLEHPVPLQTRPRHCHPPPGCRWLCRWGGSRPVQLGDGSERTFLLDGDTGGLWGTAGKVKGWKGHGSWPLETKTCGAWGALVRCLPLTALHHLPARLLGSFPTWPLFPTCSGDEWLLPGRGLPCGIWRVPRHGAAAAVRLPPAGRSAGCGMALGPQERPYIIQTEACCTMLYHEIHCA